MRILRTSAAVAALLVAAPVIAFAQESDDAEILRQSKEHYRLGTEAFKAGKYADAIKELKKAYLLKRLPLMLVNIAKTYDKLNDPDNAIYYYKKYLAEAPPDAKDRDQVKQALTDIQNRKNQPAESTAAEDLPEATTPRRQAPATAEDGEEAPPPPRRKPRPAVAEEEAPPEEAAPPPRRKTRPAVEEEAQPEEAAPPPRRKARPVAEEEAVEETPPAPRRAASAPAAMPSEWAHVPIDAAPPNTPVDVRVQTPVMKGVKVFLYYREPGTADFTPVLMKRHGPEKFGRIPGEAMGGKSIQYYIEAKDKTGVVVKNSGTQVDPNIVMIEAGAPPQIVASSSMGEGGEEGDAPPEQAVRPRRREADDERPLGGDEPAPRPRDRTSKGASSAGSGKTFSTLGYVGLGLAGGGLLVAGVGGGLGLYYADFYSGLVYNDAYNGNCRGQANPKLTGQCYFADDAFPAGQSDLDFQNNGKLANVLGITSMAVGGAMMVGGGVLAIVDYLNQRKAPKATKPAPRRRPAARRTAPSLDAPPALGDTPPDEVTPPPKNDSPFSDSTIRNLMITPVVSHQQVGLGATFNF